MLSLTYSSYYIKDYYTVAGSDEYYGNINHADMYIKDYYYGEKTLCDAEIKMDKVVLNNLIIRNNINLIIGGDLSNQLGNMNYALRNKKISFLGLYNACSTFVESMILGGKLISDSKEILLLTSSHNLVSESQFRFPVEYGSIKKKYQTNTITASIGVIVTNKKTNLKITSSTIGDVVDYEVRDVANMGAVMAPAAASVINAHLYNLNKTLDMYDYILTGDLGDIGLELLTRVLHDDYGLSASNIMDAGALIYKKEQHKGSGGSGPTCLPFAFFNKLINDKSIKRVLLVGTGALHNPTLVNQGKSIPAIAHAVEIEVNHDN